MISGCTVSSESNRLACEEFQSLNNRAFLVGDDLILNGDLYSVDLKAKVIPLADKELTVALLKMLSVMEQTNNGTSEQALDDLSSSIQVLYDSCKASGIELTR
jgi:hypothetical protein